mgnify:CR=1 FL=1
MFCTMTICTPLSFLHDGFDLTFFMLVLDSFLHLRPISTASPIPTLASLTLAVNEIRL